MEQVVKPIHFYTKKGVKLSGDLYLPPHIHPQEKLPAILLCQGLSGIKSLVLPAIAQAFTQKRWIALAFDYSGFGDSEGDPGYIDLLSRGEDALSALAYLSNQPYVDEARLGVYGISLGGGIAAYVAIHDFRVKSVVVVSGFGSGECLLRTMRTTDDWIAFKDRLNHDRQKRALSGHSSQVPIYEIFPFSENFKQKYQELLSNGGQGTALAESDSSNSDLFTLESADLILRFDITSSISKVACPLLFIHGAKDDVVPIEELLELYHKATPPKHIFIFDDCDHTDLDHDIGLAAQVQLAVDWFEKHL